LKHCVVLRIERLVFDSVEREKRGKRSSYVLRLPRIGKKGANKKTKQYICWRICAGNVLEETNKPAARLFT